MRSLSIIVSHACFICIRNSDWIHLTLRKVLLLFWNQFCGTFLINEDMDPALLKERDDFRKRALSTPVIETKRKDESGSSNSSGPSSAGPSSGGGGAGTYESLQGSGQTSAYKFGVLTKIVKHLKHKFQAGEDFPLALDEVLDETNQSDVSSKTKQWLLVEALPNNPKIDMTKDCKYSFKPPLACRDKKSLLKLLKQHDLKGLGGIMWDDVVESVPQAEKILKILEPELITITRQDKKKVLFYNDRQSDLKVDEEIQKLWRSVAVEGIDDAKIKEYLDKQGIRSMQDQGGRKTLQPRRRAQRKKVNKKLKDNEHVAESLQHYDTN